MEDYEVNYYQTNVDYVNHLYLFADCDPVDFIYVMKWRKTVKVEMNSVKENNIWEIVELPKRHKIIGVK